MLYISRMSAVLGVIMNEVYEINDISCLCDAVPGLMRWTFRSNTSHMQAVPRRNSTMLWLTLMKNVRFWRRLYGVVCSTQSFSFEYNIMFKLSPIPDWSSLVVGGHCWVYISFISRVKFSQWSFSSWSHGTWKLLAAWCLFGGRLFTLTSPVKCSRWY